MKIPDNPLSSIVVASEAQATRAVVDAPAKEIVRVERQKETLLRVEINAPTKDALLSRLDDLGQKPDRTPRSINGKFENAYSDVQRDQELDELHNLLGIDEFA